MVDPAVSDITLLRILLLFVILWIPTVIGSMLVVDKMFSGTWWFSRKRKSNRLDKRRRK